MATSLMTIRRSAAPAPILQAPFLGLALVLSHLCLGWLGLAIGRLNIRAVALGALDGTILSVIAVARAGAQFQAGTTGLLSGVSLASLGGVGDELAHKTIESAAIEGIWIAIIVVLASLILHLSASALVPEERIPRS